MEYSRDTKSKKFNTVNYALSFDFCDNQERLVLIRALYDAWSWGRNVK